ncbi:MAG: C39 family peptidase [Dissulfurispiraceae bacterium]
MKKIWFVIGACTLLALPACATAQLQKNTNSVVIRDVPFFPQEDYQCGPASLAGVLHFWKSDVSVVEIAGQIFSKSANLYVSSEDFLKTWERTNNWTLLIKPR